MVRPQLGTLRERDAVSDAAVAAIFGTVDGTFRDPRTVTRWLVEARERHGFAEWMTFHAWRKTTATVLGVDPMASGESVGESVVDGKAGN